MKEELEKLIDEYRKVILFADSDEEEVKQAEQAILQKVEEMEKGEIFHRRAL